MKRRQDGHRMRINRSSFSDSISVWISSLSRGTESRLKFLVSEIGNRSSAFHCLTIIGFLSLSLFFSLLSSSSFFSFCEEKVQVYQLQSYFFFNWFSKQWKIRGCWNWMDLNSVFLFFLFYFLLFHWTGEESSLIVVI